MNLTPEQFNILATKDDLEDLKQNITEDLGGKMDKMLVAMDKITKDNEDHAAEHVANLEAHNRMQGDINDVRKHVGLELKHPTIEPENA